MQHALQILRDFPRGKTQKKSWMPGCGSQNSWKGSLCFFLSLQQKEEDKEEEDEDKEEQEEREPTGDFWHPPPSHPGGTVALKKYKKLSTSKQLKRSSKYHWLWEEGGSLKKSDQGLWRVLDSFLEPFVRFFNGTVPIYLADASPGDFCNDARWLISCNGGFCGDGWRWWWGLWGDKVTTTLTDRSEGTEGQGERTGEVDVYYHLENDKKGPKYYYEKTFVGQSRKYNYQKTFEGQSHINTSGSKR